MTDFLLNVYVYLWAALALLCFVAGRKNGAIMYVVGLMFVFMTVWYGLRTFGGYPMFEGALGIIFRCVLGVCLALFVLVYYFSRKKSIEEYEKNSKGKDEN